MNRSTKPSLFINVMIWRRDSLIYEKSSHSMISMPHLPASLSAAEIMIQIAPSARKNRPLSLKSVPSLEIRRGAGTSFLFNNCERLSIANDSKSIDELSMTYI